MLSLVFHPLSPHAVAWKSLLPTIVDTLSRSNTRINRIEAISFQAWHQKVRLDAEAASSANVEGKFR